MGLKEYYDYVYKNKDIEYCVSFEKLPDVTAAHKWVGAQCVDNNIYGIPNDMDAVLRYRDGEPIYLERLEGGLFKWTGGCTWNGFLYGFPRTSNKLLKMSLNTENIEYVPLKNRYVGEHHYGGCCTKNGVVYQPPRDSDHILVWDLKTENVRRIYLAPKGAGRMFRYCGSIFHPNGYIYFLPETGERVVKLDTRTEEWSFIGSQIDAMVFDAKVAVDGNIYGYSAYCNGILKIDVTTDRIKMIHEEINPGAYGTKLGVNGHLYSIPGDGECVWDYNPLTDSLGKIYQFSYTLNAKFAGGTSMKNGDILAVPARENQIFQLKPNITDIEIPEEIFREYFVDCY